MTLRKRRHDAPRENQSRIERYRVTSRLCRGDVVEFGCGDGELAKAIHDRGCAVTGVDKNEAKIARAREKYPYIRFIQSDVQHLDLRDADFDTALIAEVLEHVTDDVGMDMLRRAWSLLRPGGRLIVSVPNEDAIPHPNHIRRFDRQSLELTLRPFGVPNLCVDQPFKWLMMHVTKGD
jgi:2-polyprenyl-3-methyl-5-hydroxy-6-metoxy-1,4-benzoquinol methylase